MSCHPIFCVTTATTFHNYCPFVEFIIAAKGTSTIFTHLLRFSLVVSLTRTIKIYTIAAKAVYMMISASSMSIVCKFIPCKDMNSCRHFQIYLQFIFILSREPSAFTQIYLLSIYLVKYLTIGRTTAHTSSYP